MPTRLLVILALAGRMVEKKKAQKKKKRAVKKIQS